MTEVWGLPRGHPERPSWLVATANPLGLPASALSLQPLLPVARGMLLGYRSDRILSLHPKPSGASFQRENLIKLCLSDLILYLSHLLLLLHSCSFWNTP